MAHNRNTPFSVGFIALPPLFPSLTLALLFFGTLLGMSFPPTNPRHGATAAAAAVAAAADEDDDDDGEERWPRNGTSFLRADDKSSRCSLLVPLGNGSDPVVLESKAPLVLLRHKATTFWSVAMCFSREDSIKGERPECGAS